MERGPRRRQADGVGRKEERETCVRRENKPMRSERSEERNYNAVIK
jgi:hypothetical protein